jgi:hypothetical protein
MTITENGVETKERWDPGVQSYAGMGYWNPDYVPRKPTCWRCSAWHRRTA